MFSKTISVLYISRTRIRAARVFSGKESRAENVSDVEWTPESLDAVLGSMCSQIGNTIRVVLADDLSYVINLPSPKGSAPSRDMIRNEAQGCIPENMERIAWDFGVMEEKSLSGASGSLKTIQVMAASETFLNDIVPSMVRAGFIVDALEAEACSLARLVGADRDILLLVYDEKDGNHLLLVLDHGIVRTTERIIGFLATGDIEKTLSFARNRYGQDIRNIFFSGKAYDGISGAMQEKHFQVESTLLDPCIGIALKKDMEGSDQDVLNMDMLPQAVGSHRIKRSEKRLFRIFIAVSLCGAIAVSGILMYRKKTFSLRHDARIEVSGPMTPQQDAQENPIDFSAVSENMDVAASGITVDISSYRVSVLNGSGEKGAAGKLKSVLVEGGFSVNTVGNAPGSSTETFFEVKASVPEEVRKVLIDTVRPIYILAQEIQALDDSSDQDIIITLGSEKTTTKSQDPPVEAQHN